MTRWLLIITVGVVLGAIVHLVTVMLLPRTATLDAYARLTPMTPVNAVVPLPPPTPDSASMPFMDPAFAAAICRYDLSRGPLKFVVPVSPAYTSVSFYTRYDIAYYAINDRAAGRRTIELELMTPDQRAELPDDEEVTAADRLIVEFSDHNRPDRNSGSRARARADARGARCSRGGTLHAAERAGRNPLISNRRRPGRRGRSAPICGRRPSCL